MSACAGSKTVGWNPRTGKGGPVGDKVGPDSAAFEVKAAPCKKGDLIRLVISPNDWWGTDLTRIDYFRITRVK